MKNFSSIGEIIKYYRLTNDISQAALAEGICSREYLGKIERNECIPTLAMINQLSHKLEINLYDTYAIMLRHHNIETHQKIEKLNDFFSEENIHLLPKLIEEYESLDNFQYGEPYQHLMYAKSICLSNLENQYMKAIQLAAQGLSLNHENLDDLLNHKQHYSNIELALLLSIAVNYCRCEEIETGKKYFKVLHTYLIHLLTQSHYAINKNNHFEINLLCNITYNKYVFCAENTFQELSEINQVIELMKDLRYSYSLPELLLCKSALENKLGLTSEAAKTYQIAHSIGLFLYSEDYQLDLEKNIFADRDF